MTHGETVKAAITTAGLALWREAGLEAVSARAVAFRLGMTHGNVLHHFGTAAGMKDAIAAEAVRTGCRVVVPQLIANRHAAVADMAAVDRAGYLAGV